MNNLVTYKFEKFMVGNRYKLLQINNEHYKVSVYEFNRHLQFITNYKKSITSQIQNLYKISGGDGGDIRLFRELKDDSKSLDFYHRDFHNTVDNLKKLSRTLRYLKKHRKIISHNYEGLERFESLEIHTIRTNMVELKFSYIRMFRYNSITQAKLIVKYLREVMGVSNISFNNETKEIVLDLGVDKEVMKLNEILVIDIFDNIHFQSDLKFTLLNFIKGVFLDNRYL